MLILKNADTPRGTVEAVLEFLQNETQRYREQARAATSTHQRNRDQAIVNAFLTAHMHLADCNVMRGEP